MRIDLRNFAISTFRRLLSPDSICAADSSCEEADLVSPAPRRTSIRRNILCALHVPRNLTTGCARSSTAVAIVEEISDKRSMVPEMSLIAVIESCVAAYLIAPKIPSAASGRMTQAGAKRRLE